MEMTGNSIVSKSFLYMPLYWLDVFRMVNVVLAAVLNGIDIDPTSDAILDLLRNGDIQTISKAT